MEGRLEFIGNSALVKPNGPGMIRFSFMAVKRHRLSRCSRRFPNGHGEQRMDIPVSVVVVLDRYCLLGAK